MGIAMGELETQLTLSDLIHDTGFTENKDWEAAAVGFVEDLCVPCAGYAKHLLQFVRLCGGWSWSSSCQIDGQCGKDLPVPCESWANILASNLNNSIS